LVAYKQYANMNYCWCTCYCK